MKSVISALLASFCWLIAPTGAAYADAMSEILRNAALKNGLRPAGQLYISRDSSLAGVGRTFFESRNVSLNGNMACRTCHLDRFGSADGLPNAIGIFGQGEGVTRAQSAGRIVPRNTLPLWGRGSRWFRTFFWDGKVDFSQGNRISQFGEHPPSDDPLTVAVHLPPVEIREMLNDEGIVTKLKQETPKAAGALYTEVVGRLRRYESEAMTVLAKKVDKKISDITFFDVARSITAFIRSEFRLRDTKFHRFVFGQGELTPDELNGGLIFYGKGKCVNCHTGPHFSDFKFHAVPFPQLGFGKNGFGVDYGRFNVTFKAGDLYRFRTPPLFNVEKTAPYGHSGSLATLRETIVAHFDPLASVDPVEMDALARHEFFKRMAAVGDTFKMLSVLNDAEIAEVETFLKSLSFD